MRKKFFLFCLISTLISCSEKTENKVQSNTNEALIRQYFDHFNKHEWVKMANFYTDSADFKDPTLGKGIVKQTREQTAKKYGELSEIFKDIRDDIEHVYPSGDKHIIVEFISKGTASDGSKFELPICTIFTIEHGKITQDFTYFDDIEEPK
jgi:ketosteroid isomerase-like protein